MIKMSEFRCSNLIYLVLFITPVIFGFNVDHINYIRYGGKPDTMFGFSVALHKEANKTWVIIGSPREDSSVLQSNVRRGGVVYRCETVSDQRCQIIPFDTTGASFNDRGEQVDTKDDQWFGATVASAGEDGPIVACAPRYVFHTMQPRRVERVEPVGTCHMVRDNFSKYVEYSPCRTSYWGYHRQGSCQAGFSAAVTKDGGRLFVGAPGSWYWQGQEYSYDLRDPRNRVYATGESNLLEDDSYLGYSTTTGDFNGDGVQGMAVGMPRGGGLLGKVLIFSWNMINQHNITGEQIGAYFGYSLCSIDVDNDKLDDLIIGAPMYTEPNNEGKYEMGRVYIMFQGQTDKFKTLVSRDGINSRGRFGLSLASLGDINSDGFGDFAVGAPYDGPMNRGAVYIYHGSPSGPLLKHSQVIFAEDVVGTPGLSTFGFALSGGIDVDGNLYPDLLVGAYESENVFLFRSRPVAVIEATTVFQMEPKLISLDQKNCTTKFDGQKVTCTLVRSCLKYTGKNLPRVIDLEVSWVLDAQKRKTPRMFFLTYEGKSIRNITMRLQRGTDECVEEGVYIVDNIRDKLTPLEVEMRYQMRSTPITHIRNQRSVLNPVIDQNREVVQRDALNIQKNCGPDNICYPDIKLEIKTPDKYLFGSKDLLIVEVLISNFGEDAFETSFYMTLPEDLHYKKIERINVHDTLPTCSPPSPETNYTLKCDIGNPLAATKVSNFKVIMIPSKKSGMAPSYDLYMEANSTNAEVAGSNFDNVVKKSISIWVNTDLSIEGSTTAESAQYNSSKFKPVENATTELDIGPHVVHMYNIRNNGPSTIQKADVYILWPFETLGGDVLMYLLNQPETSGNIQCNHSVYANTRGLALDPVMSKKNYLQSKVGTVSSQSAYTGVHTEQSNSSYKIISGSFGGKLTKEERERLDAERYKESVGDSYYGYRDRINNAAATNRTIIKESKKEIIYGPDGTPHVVETSTEYYVSAGFGGNKRNSSLQGSQIGGIQSSSTYQAGIHQRTQDGRQTGNYDGQGSQYGHHHISSGAQGGSHSGNTQGSYGSQSNTVQGGFQSVSHQQSAGSQGGASHISEFEKSQEFGGSQRQHSSHEHSSQPGINQRPAASQSGSLHYASQGGGSSHQATQGRNYEGGSSSYQASQGRNYEGGSSSQASAIRHGSQMRNYEANGSENRLSDHVSQSGSMRGAEISQQSSQSMGNINQGLSDRGTLQHSQFEQNEISGRRRMKSQQDGEEPRPDLITGVTELNKMGQGGRFHVGTLDVGTINRGGNVDDELRRSSSASHLSQDGNSQYSQSNSYARDSGNTGHYSRSQSSHSGGKYHTAGGINYATNVNHGRGNTNMQYNDYTENYYDDINEDGKSNGARNQRLKRNVEEDEFNKLLKCKNAQCAAIYCTVGPLEKDESAWVGIRVRLSATTMNKIASSFSLNTSTMAISRITELPYIGSPKEKQVKTRELIFTAIPDPIQKPDVVPLWVVVLSACAGTVILLLLALILYKCGFFNRNRPSDASERQPLNRNNGYHGDEHL